MFLTRSEISELDMHTHTEQLQGCCHSESDYISLSQHPPPQRPTRYHWSLPLFLDLYCIWRNLIADKICTFLYGSQYYLGIILLIRFWIIMCTARLRMIQHTHHIVGYENRIISLPLCRVSSSRPEIRLKSACPWCVCSYLSRYAQYSSEPCQPLPRLGRRLLCLPAVLHVSPPRVS